MVKRHMTDKKTTSKKKKTETKKNSYQKEVEELNKKLKEKEQKILRNLADIQNLQKRMQKEIECCRQETKKKYLSEMIDLHDLLKKAIEDNSPKEGLKLMMKNIENFFEKENIQTIECIGKKFDHNCHHALTTIERDDCEDDTVIEEVKKGYKLGDKTLRPSQVIVAKKTEKK